SSSRLLFEVVRSGEGARRLAPLRLFGDLLSRRLGDVADDVLGDVAAPVGIAREGEGGLPRVDGFLLALGLGRLCTATHEEEGERDGGAHQRATRIWFCTSRTPPHDSAKSSARRFIY